MKEITKYMAEDGTVFDDYEECHTYEESIIVSELEHAFEFFNAKGEKLNPREYKSLTTMYEEDISYIKIIDVNYIDTFGEFLDREGYYFKIDNSVKFTNGDILEFDRSEWSEWRNFSQRILHETALFEKMKESN